MADNFIKLFEYPHLGLIASLLFLILSFNPVNLYAMWRLYQRLEQGESLPERLENFPVQATSMQDYLNSWEKVESFNREVLRGNSYKLTLNSSDINHIYLKGNSINKYSVNNLYELVPLMPKYHNKFLYYHVVNNAVLKKEIEYFTMSSIGMPDGIVTQNWGIRFKNTEDGVLQNGCVVEWNGKKMDSERDWTDNKFTSSVRGSTLLTSILTGDFGSQIDKDINQQSMIALIISKITKISISECVLIIEVCRHKY